MSNMFSWQFLLGAKPATRNNSKMKYRFSMEMLTACVSLAAGRRDGPSWARRRRRQTAAASGAHGKSQRGHRRSRKWSSGGANQHSRCASATKRPLPKRTTTRPDPFRTFPSPTLDPDKILKSWVVTLHGKCFWTSLAGSACVSV